MAPLQNRVTPEGDIIATTARGLLMGNRGGCLHDDARRLGSRRWVSRRWIACLLDFKGRRRTMMAPGRYTELFFLDEATALAAGHRPCFECRRGDALRFADLWARAVDGAARADEIDARLHAERLYADGRKRTFQQALGDLPDGTIVRLAAGSGPMLVLGRRLIAWTPDGYGAARTFDTVREAEVLTPPSIIAAMKSGYVPMMHETAKLSG